MKNFKPVYVFAMALLLLQSCAIVRPGEVGLDTHFGKLQPKVLQPGPHHFFSLFGKKVVRFDTRVVNYSQKLNFHTQEGIEVSSEITILYHVMPESIVSIYKRFGTDYQEIVIADNLITTLRFVGLGYKATELITARTSVEDSIKERMMRTVGQYGFMVDLVMLKEVDLPPAVVQTIQAKLNAEVTAKKTKIDNEIRREMLDFELEKQQKEAEMEIVKQRLTLDFAIEKQKKESERLLIESEGIKKSQDIINTSITDKLIKFKALDITRELMKSPNSKIIITDGKSPVILGDNNK